MKKVIDVATYGFFATGHDQDDLRQVAAIGVWEAWKGWDPDRGQPFHRFALMCARRKVITLVEYSNKEKRRGDKHTVALDVARLEDREEPALVSDETLRLRELLAETPLTPLEREVMGWLLKGYGYTDTAQMVGLTYKQVDNIRQKVLSKMRGATRK